MLKINLHAPMHLTRLVAPAMTEKKRARCPNCSSSTQTESYNVCLCRSQNTWHRLKV